MDLKVIHLSSIDSTNNYAARLLSENQIMGPTLVVADYQEQGRGYGSNHWFSSPGQNLLASLYLIHSQIPANEQFIINCMVSSVIAEFLENELKMEIKIKWPNDIYVYHLKIAGLLIENYITGNELSSSIIGIGLNVNQEDFPDEVPNPTSMFLLDHQIRNPFEIGVSIANHIIEIHSNRDRYDQAREKYLLRLYQKGVKANYLLKGKKIQGMITGVDPFGQLILQEGVQEHRCGYKEVVYLPNNKLESEL